MAHEIHFGIKEIREVEFLVNEQIEITPSYDFNYKIEIATRIPEEAVTFMITANFLTHGKQELFMKGKTATTFHIKDLKSHSKIVAEKEMVDLPDALLITMFSISFSHARALLAKSSAGSKYSHMLIPLINPDQEFRRVFGPNLEKINQ